MERHNVTVGEKPVVSMDIEEGKVKLEWKTSLLRKTLDHVIDKCVGCSLCIPCPWEAITLGPVQETAAGRIEGAPLVNVDPELCTFCGLCDSSCIFKAFEARYEGEGAINDFVDIDGIHRIDEEKCAPCLLCEKVCPTGSLHAEVKVDWKKDLVKYEGEESAKGTIKIDEDKCSLCGLCELLCPEAIKIYWSDSAEPPDFRPAVSIRAIDEECDYCGLCAKICPDEAIAVECTESSPRTIKEPTISGTLEHNDETCVKCGLCAQVCPYDALEVTKPFSGEVVVARRDKCDPIGCHNCFNICPVKAIYPTGTDEKIDIADNCVYCGACEHSCPYDVLETRREGYNVQQLEKVREWEKARRLFFEAVIGNDPPKSGLFEREITVLAAERARVNIREGQGWEEDDAIREKAIKIAKHTLNLLKSSPRLTLQVERGHLDKVVEKIKGPPEASQEK
jgi:4Fe-4S ferredoxin